MKKLLWAIAVLVVVAAQPATAQQPDPIDTNKLVVKPTRAIADLTAATINLAGDATAGQIKGNGYLKTFNNLFRKPTPNTMQIGPSPLPQPGLFRSTQYKNYNTPVMPTAMPVRR
jgi:hypothetical protein